VAYFFVVTMKALLKYWLAEVKTPLQLKSIVQSDSFSVVTRTVYAAKTCRLHLFLVEFPQSRSSTTLQICPLCSRL